MQLGHGAMKFGRFRDGKEKKTNPKTLFRQSKRWKDFRAAMIEMNSGRCELCGMRYTASKHHLLQVHHLHPEEYENLDPAKFSVLCSSCHDLAERFVTRINGRDFSPPDNFGLWMQLLLAHISHPARQKSEAIIAGNYQETKIQKPKKVKRNEI